MPRLHPREEIVTRAQIDLTAAVLAWREEHAELTPWELVRVLSGVLDSQLGGVAKYMIRAERHPDDPDKPGGWE
jgi:hypothetical protein